MMHARQKPDIVFSASAGRWFQPAMFLGVIPVLIYLTFQILTSIYAWPGSVEFWVVGALACYIVPMIRRLFPLQVELSITKNVLLARNGLYSKALNRSHCTVRYIRWGAAMAINAKQGVAGTIVEVSDSNQRGVTIGAYNVVLNDNEYDNETGGSSFQRTDCTFELPEEEFYTLVHWLQTGEVDRTIRPNESAQSALPGEDNDIYLDSPEIYELQPIQAVGIVVLLLFAAGFVGIALLGYVFGGPDFSNVGTRLILVTLLAIPGIWLFRRVIKHLLNRKHLSLQFTEDQMIVNDHKDDQVLAQCAINDMQVHYCMHRVETQNSSVEHDVLEIHIPGMEALTIRTSFLFEFDGEQRLLKKAPTYHLAPALTTFLVRRLRPAKVQEPVYQAPPPTTPNWFRPVMVLVSIFWALIIAGVLYFSLYSGATGPADCGNEEQYSELFGECRNEREMACEVSPACTQEGRCSTRGPGHHCVGHPELCDEVCQNLQPRSCALSENCQTKGQCSMHTGTGHCGVMTDQDCGLSEACTKHGRCIARQNNCVPAESPVP